MLRPATHRKSDHGAGCVPSVTTLFTSTTQPTRTGEVLVGATSSSHVSCALDCPTKFHRWQTNVCHQDQCLPSSLRLGGHVSHVSHPNSTSAFPASGCGLPLQCARGLAIRPRPQPPASPLVPCRAAPSPGIVQGGRASESPGSAVVGPAGRCPPSVCDLNSPD